MHVKARLPVVADRDIANAAQDLALLGYWNVAVRLAGKIEPPYGRPGKRAERGQRWGKGPTLRVSVLFHSDFSVGGEPTRGDIERLVVSRGTDGSNPVPSSGESVSLPHPLSKVENPGFPRGCARLA